MDRRVFVLALASFAMGTEAYVYAGHLAALADDLDVTVAAAGQLATAFALTYALTAPITTGMAAAIDRRTVLVAGLVVIGVLNIAAAASPGFASLIGVRVLCGIAAGLVGPAASAAAATLAPPERRGQALAVVLGGMTLAFVLGIPLGSVVGEVFGWRSTFVFAGVLALLAATAIRMVLPAVPGGERSGLGGLLVVREAAVALPLVLTLVGFAATFSVIAYVGPVVTGISGLEGAGVGVMQALIGVGSIIGIVLGGAAADRPGAARLLGASFLVSAAALGSYTALMLAASRGADAGLLAGGLALATVLGAAALFARTPIIQARLVGAAPQTRSLVLALNGSMVFIGQGLGAAFGGTTIAAAGLTWVGVAGALVALLGAALTLTPAVRPLASAATPTK